MFAFPSSNTGTTNAAYTSGLTSNVQTYQSQPYSYESNVSTDNASRSVLNRTKVVLARTFPAGGGAVAPSAVARRSGSTTSSGVLPRESNGSTEYLNKLIMQHLQTDSNANNTSVTPASTSNVASNMPIKKQYKKRPTYSDPIPQPISSGSAYQQPEQEFVVQTSHLSNLLSSPKTSVVQQRYNQEAYNSQYYYGTDYYPSAPSADRTQQQINNYYTETPVENTDTSMYDSSKMQGVFASSHQVNQQSHFNYQPTNQTTQPLQQPPQQYYSNIQQHVAPAADTNAYNSVPNPDPYVFQTEQDSYLSQQQQSVVSYASVPMSSEMYGGQNSYPQALASYPVPVSASVVRATPVDFSNSYTVSNSTNNNNSLTNYSTFETPGSGNMPAVSDFSYNTSGVNNPVKSSKQNVASAQHYNAEQQTSYQTNNKASVITHSSSYVPPEQIVSGDNSCDVPVGGNYKISDFPPYLSGPLKAQLQTKKTSSLAPVKKKRTRKATPVGHSVGGAPVAVCSAENSSNQAQSPDSRVENNILKLLPEQKHVKTEVKVASQEVLHPGQILTFKMGSSKPVTPSTESRLPLLQTVKVVKQVSHVPKKTVDIKLPSRQEIESDLKRIKLEREKFVTVTIAPKGDKVTVSPGAIAANSFTKVETTVNAVPELEETPVAKEETKIAKADEALKPVTTSQENTRKRKSSMSDTRAVTLLMHEDQNASLQDKPCVLAANNLPSCRDCHESLMKNIRLELIVDSHSCRFFKFRKIRKVAFGRKVDGGFARPRDATVDELMLWMPNPDKARIDEEAYKTAVNIMWNIGDQFCRLVQQEREVAAEWNGLPAWKRAVQGVREMCDVCQTTLFNLHWVCPNCGFVACIDCYNARKSGVTSSECSAEEGDFTQLDEFEWLFCTNGLKHDVKLMMLTQILPGQVLERLGELAHSVRNEWGIRAQCVCPLNKNPAKPKRIENAFTKQLMSSVSKTFRRELDGIQMLQKNNECGFESTKSMANGGASDDLRLLADVALASASPISSNTSTSSLDVTKKSVESSLYSASQEPDTSSLDLVMPIVAELCRKARASEEARENIPPAPPLRFLNSMKEPVPSIRMCAQPESSLQFTDVNHSWLCNGRLLVLHEPRNPRNIELFQEQWKRGQPVMVTDVSKNLDMTMWHPDGFSRDFGNEKNDLVDCRSGEILQNVPMKKFWNGFERVSMRLTDQNGDYRLLKLKDWPPGDDFRDVLPERFDDLMKALPLPEYTHRDGIYNLAGRLPEYFVRPDLGPKMYNAYGSALFPSKGTTNLHLDVSDAANVMVYVGVADDGHDSEAALKAVDEGGCDVMTRRRVREKHVRVGALWHIFHASDADKIRQLLQKVAQERGLAEEAHTDPIHDQSWYLDGELRQRLFREYGVEGYAIAQCLGDVVFIPAGAPHQVRNLHSCVKVAEDFVSPENIEHCFRLTNEFRALSDTHTNHEDKLQIKNVIYHAVKDVVATLTASLREFQKNGASKTMCAKVQNNGAIEGSETSTSASENTAKTESSGSNVDGSSNVISCGA